MKKIALIVALLTCAAVLFSCGEPTAKDILDDDGKAVATGYYDGDKLLYEEKVDDRGELSEKTTYDDDGNIEKVESFFLGKLKSESVYTYTDKEGDYSEKLTSYSAQGVAVSVTEREYEDGLVVKETVTKNEGSENESVEENSYTYNDDGTVLKEVVSGDKTVSESLTDKKGAVIYDKQISESGSAIKTFYENDRISKIENYTAEGALLITIVNKYGEDGTISETESYDADGNLKDYTKYVYSGEKLLGLYKYYADGTIHSTIQYDEDGKATVHNGMYVDLD